jgi:iron complex outermembrane receptor protein
MLLRRFLFRNLFFLFLIAASNTAAQQRDTIKLEEVIVKGYLLQQPLTQTPASVAILNSDNLAMRTYSSLLPSMNSVPGLRMEERSPGSYRLSIRGSLLRSPFGVRNVKVYLNDLPFTDASGNTYINLIDPSQFQDVEILKGPDGSLFGANSGGVVLLNTDSPPRDSLTLQANASGGSYGLFREHIRVHHTSKRMEWNFGEAFQRADGYRQQSFMKRLNLLGSGKFRYGKQNSVKLFGLYSDLQYETPGGLTKEQFETDSQQARPGTTEQQTGIYNETLFGGMTNEIVLAGSFRHIVSVFGTSTSFKNPFITNFEIRREKNAGIRSFLEYAFLKKTVELRWYAGLEGQWGNQDISNYENNSGKPGTLQASDKIGIGQVFYFTRLTLDVDSKLTIQASVSLNQSTYSFKGFNDKNLSNEWMPRIAASYLFFPELALPRPHEPRTSTSP